MYTKMYGIIVEENEKRFACAINIFKTLSVHFPTGAKAIRKEIHIKEIADGARLYRARARSYWSPIRLLVHDLMQIANSSSPNTLNVQNLKDFEKIWYVWSDIAKFRIFLIKFCAKNDATFREYSATFSTTFC